MLYVSCDFKPRPHRLACLINAPMTVHCTRPKRINVILFPWLAYLANVSIDVTLVIGNRIPTTCTLAGLYDSSYIKSLVCLSNVNKSWEHNGKVGLVKHKCIHDSFDLCHICWRSAGDRQEASISTRETFPHCGKYPLVTNVCHIHIPVMEMEVYNDMPVHSDCIYSSTNARQAIGPPLVPSSTNCT